MIHLDTSVLVDALTGARHSAGALRTVVGQGERLAISALVLYEWQRGPRAEAELAAQEDLFPSADAVSFGAREAASRLDSTAPCRARDSGSSISRSPPVPSARTPRCGR